MFIDNNNQKFIGYIYCITNEINKKRYVGQTIQDYKKRWNRHIYDLNNNKHMNEHLQSAWNKYGEENFLFKLLEILECDTEEKRRKLIDEKESFYINKWNLLDKKYGYNIASGGSNGNPLAGKTEKELEEIAQKKREKMSGENSPNKDKHPSRKTREKMSEAKQGKNNPNYGKKWTDERKHKSSEKHKGKKFTDKHIENLILSHIKAYVKCIELDIIQPGCNEMMRYLRKNGYPTAYSTAINKVCNGERKQHLGLHFEWVEIENKEDD